ncbi:hypothetical protein [Clostridium sp. C2-6-12]|uniref:hypothetical protein n=1 Tax=Clostridium sp. C2-6-12 TaxID=2698832 RepID=UPI00136C44D3|nr:hypothetical protein [Clostridium sp. C2-6-12]
MNYKGWIMNIYDRYKLKYKERYTDDDKNSFKNFNKINDLNAIGKILMILYFAFVIVGGISYFVGLYLNSPVVSAIGLIAEVVPPMLLIYNTKFEQDEYKKCVRVLREVLEEENIKTIPVIKRLIKDTAGVLYRIKDGEVNNYIKLLTFISASGLMFGVSNYLNKIEIKNNNAIIIIEILIIIAIIGGIIYILRMVNPGSKYAKQKELHEILKILLIYEEGKKK